MFLQLLYLNFGEKPQKHSQATFQKLAVLPVDGRIYWKVETYLTFQ